MGWVYSHDIKSNWKRGDGKVFKFGEGLKLMEHSYIDNKLMRCIEGLLIAGGAWYKKNIVWAGDYADGEVGTVDETNPDGISLYFMCEDKTKLIPKALSLVQSKKHRYIVNHSTKQYVDKQAVPSYNGNWKIHPLSLLTCEGNGRGGGDYRGNDEIVGIWARHSISLETEIPIGYEKLIFNLTE